jgi:hypothetical protein
MFNWNTQKIRVSGIEPTILYSDLQREETTKEIAENVKEKVWNGGHLGSAGLGPRYENDWEESNGMGFFSRGVARVLGRGFSKEHKRTSSATSLSPIDRNFGLATYPGGIPEEEDATKSVH